MARAALIAGNGPASGGPSVTSSQTTRTTIGSPDQPGRWQMRRREFIAGLGSAAWLVVARAQQPAMPVIGVVSAGSADASADHVRAFRKGLSETGYVEDQNVTVEYHYLEGQYDRLPALMADLVRRRVAVIVTGGGSIARAAKAATATIPIIFGIGLNPINAGLVASLARPGQRDRLQWFHPERRSPSGWDSCMTWCPRPFVLPC